MCPAPPALSGRGEGGFVCDRENLEDRSGPCANKKRASMRLGAGFGKTMAGRITNYAAVKADKTHPKSDNKPSKSANRDVI